MLCDRLPVGHPCSAEPRRAPHLLAPSLVCFLNTSVGKQRAEPAGTEVVCSTHCESCENSIRTEGQDRRASHGQAWGEETHPTLLSTIPAGSRNPLVSAVGAQPSETWCPNQGSCDPRGRVWGLGGSHPNHVGPDPVPGDPVSALHLCILPLGDPQHLN